MYAEDVKNIMTQNVVFEDEFRHALTERTGEPPCDYTSSMHMPDFNIATPKYKVWFECKEKNKPYKMSNWTDFQKLSIPECNAFIIDEYSVLHLCYYSPFIFVIVKNKSYFYVYDILDLMCMPKIRNNRKVGNSLKGKWLLDLRWAVKTPSINESLGVVAKKCVTLETVYGQPHNRHNSVMACHGHYLGEDLMFGGIERTNKHRQADLLENQSAMAI